MRKLWGVHFLYLLPRVDERKTRLRRRCDVCAAGDGAIFFTDMKCQAMSNDCAPNHYRVCAMVTLGSAKGGCRRLICASSLIKTTRETKRD
jgi:hypothetical protein